MDIIKGTVRIAKGTALDFGGMRNEKKEEGRVNRKTKVRTVRGRKVGETIREEGKADAREEQTAVWK